MREDDEKDAIRRVGSNREPVTDARDLKSTSELETASDEEAGSWSPDDERPAGSERRDIGSVDPNGAGRANVATNAESRTRVWHGVSSLLMWSPKACRYDPDNPPRLSLGLNILFGAAAMVTVANLYYNQPILNRIAETFGVSFEQSSTIATLTQAGYAAGLLLICPLGDVFPRRPFILCLIAFTATIWLALCLSTSFNLFRGISFVAGFTTVTPQLMLPLVGELAPPHRKATSMSIVVCGLALGMLVARVLSGIVANYTDWRNIYWVGFALQWTLLTLLFLFLPDYPSKNPDGLNYIHMLWTIAKLTVTKPALLQTCIIAFCMSAVFTSYWTTLSFLLSSAPYFYPPIVIGLFGLIGIFAICCGPVYSRFIMDKLVYHNSVVIGVALTMVGVSIGLSTGTFTVAGPILQAMLNDFGNQVSTIAMRTVIYRIDPKASNRINTAYMLAAFSGQLTGTAAGNRLYAQGGWRYSEGLSLGLLGFALLVTLARGPKETGWVGWGGGWGFWRDDLPPRKPEVAATADVEATADSHGLGVPVEETKGATPK